MIHTFYGIIYSEHYVSEISGCCIEELIEEE
jgi:hypothetical protein